MRPCHAHADQTHSQTSSAASPSLKSPRTSSVPSLSETLLKLISDISCHIVISLTPLWHVWNLLCITCYLLLMVFVHFCYLVDPFHISLVSWRNYRVILLSCLLLYKIDPTFPYSVSSNQSYLLSPVHISRSSWSLCSALCALQPPSPHRPSDQLHRLAWGGRTALCCPNWKAALASVLCGNMAGFISDSHRGHRKCVMGKSRSQKARLHERQCDRNKSSLKPAWKLDINILTS